LLNAAAPDPNARAAYEENQFNRYLQAMMAARSGPQGGRGGFSPAGGTGAYSAPPITPTRTASTPFVPNPNGTASPYAGYGDWFFDPEQSWNPDMLPPDLGLPTDVGFQAPDFNESPLVPGQEFGPWDEGWWNLNAPIAPLRSADVLGAIQAGSNAGLAMRAAAQREAAQESENQRAAASLQFNYEQLAAQQQHQQEAIQAQKEEAAASLALRGQQAQALQQHQAATGSP
jgi:hypothetical protein